MKSHDGLQQLNVAIHVFTQAGWRLIHCEDIDISSGEQVLADLYLANGLPTFANVVSTSTVASLVTDSQ